MCPESLPTRIQGIPHLPLVSLLDLTMHQRGDHLADYVVDFNSHNTRLRQLVTDYCGRIEWIWVVLAQNVIVRRLGGVNVDRGCDPGLGQQRFREQAIAILTHYHA